MDQPQSGMAAGASASPKQVLSGSHVAIEPNIEQHSRAPSPFRTTDQTENATPNTTIFPENPSVDVCESANAQPNKTVEKQPG